MPSIRDVATKVCGAVACGVGSRLRPNRRSLLLPVLFVGVVWALPSYAASSAAACEIWKDERRLLALGRHAIATPSATLRTTLRAGRSCMRPERARAETCEWLDRDGIAYLADEEERVVRVEARRGVASPRAVLPLGLKLGDPFDDAVAKLGKLPDESPREQLRQHSSTNRRALATGECVVHGNAPPASFFLEFDGNRRLKRVGLMISNV